MENHLEQLEEFEKILANYHISETGNRILTKARMVLLVGASATGRDTIIRELLATGEYYDLVSDTTRKPRINNGILEKNGVEYWFRTEHQFLDDLRTGRLLEAEIIHKQHVSGISLRELQKAVAMNKIAITNVELNIKNIVTAKPDTYAVMVLPPGFDEWMHRLENRGKMNQTEKKRRIQTALQIFNAGLEWPFFRFVINDKLEHAVSEIHDIVTGQQKASDQTQGRELLSNLIVATKRWLDYN